MAHMKIHVLSALLALLALTLFGCASEEEESGETQDAPGADSDGDGKGGDSSKGGDGDKGGDSSKGGDDCACLFQGSQISSDIYMNYPTSDPGKYENLSAVAIYGSTCAAWDGTPGTPWFDSCSNESSDWSSKAYNWCQQPWCYVSDKCTSGVASSVFAGSTAAFYSYAPCGSTADCFSNLWNNESYPWPEGCPYDPNGDNSYKVFKDDCACLYHSKELDTTLYTDFPSDDPGKYSTLANIKSYGTTCAAWDQVPETPWASYCPTGSDWCSQGYNWCQEPWCYVSSSCSSKIATMVFNGSTVGFFSYETCLSTPDCYTGVADTNGSTANAPEACPFDITTNGWYTPKKCSGSWTD